jgi:hypothetical protein
MSPPPHRTLVCAQCGAHPRWVVLDPNDPRPVALCSRCSQHNDYDCTPPTPPTPPASAAPLPKVAPLTAARGSSIPTTVALAAVFVAAFLPNAAVAAWRVSSRVAPAIDAALRVLDRDEDPPHAPRFARARSRVAPTPEPARLASDPPLAQPILPPCTLARAASADVDGPPSTRGFVVTREFARALPAALGLRERDVVTHLDGFSVLDDRNSFRVCGIGKRSFVLRGERDGRSFSRLVSCSASAARPEVAPRPPTLITASR